MGTDQTEEGVLFYVPVGPQSGWKSENAFPQAFCEVFRAVFTATFLSSPSRETRLASYKRNHSSSMPTRRCLNRTIVCGGSYPMMFKKSRGNVQRACDSCFRAGRPCVRLVRYENRVHLGVYPLHIIHQDGARWDQLGFWVRGHQR